MNQIQKNLSFRRRLLSAAALLLLGAGSAQAVSISFRTCAGGFHPYLGADGSGMAVTPNGQAYFTGSTSTPDFPHPGGAQGDGVETDAFVVKLDLAGNIQRATYFDLLQYEFGIGIALDASNNPVISGVSRTDYGTGQAFVAKLSTLLDTVLWQKTFGGSAEDQAIDVAIDAGGNIFAGGTTESADFCTAGAMAGKCTVKTAMAGGDTKDGFLVKLGPNGGISWATLAGGNTSDSGVAVAVDGSGRPYVGGYFYVPATATVAAKHPSWVRRYAADGLSLGYAFNFGTAADPAQPLNGATINALQDLAVDAYSNLYVTGFTNSQLLGAVGAVQPNLGGGRDAFVGMINNSGTGLVFLTYQGNGGNDYGRAIAVGDNQQISVVGSRQDTDPDGDVAIARYSAGGAGRLFYSAFGGSRTDHGVGLALDSARNMYVAGTTYSNDFDSGDAHCNALVATNNDGAAFAVKVLP
jgi:hypothetical protein